MAFLPQTKKKNDNLLNNSEIIAKLEKRINDLENIISKGENLGSFKTEWMEKARLYIIDNKAISLTKLTERFPSFTNTHRKKLFDGIYRKEIGTIRLPGKGGGILYIHCPGENSYLKKFINAWNNAFTIDKGLAYSKLIKEFGLTEIELREIKRFLTEFLSRVVYSDGHGIYPRSRQPRGSIL